jgi:hypothetical protein
MQHVFASKAGTGRPDGTGPSGPIALYANPSFFNASSGTTNFSIGTLPV